MRRIRGSVWLKLWAATILVASACEDSSDPAAPPTADGGTLDGSSTNKDGSTGSDAGNPLADGSTPDTSVNDASTNDVATSDGSDDATTDGAVGDTGTNDAALDAGSCSPVVVLDQWDGGEAGSPAEWPQVTTAPAGAAIATWEEKGNPLSRITASIYSTSSSTWSTPELVAVGQQAKSAISPIGDAIVMWREPNGSGSFEKWRRIYRPGSGWNTPLELSTTGGSDRNLVAFGANGDGLMLWESTIAGKIRLRAQRFISSNGTETTPVSIDDGSANVFYPTLAIGPTNVAYAFWTLSGGTVHVARHENGSWTAAAVSPATATTSVSFLRAAVDASGQATVLTKAVVGGQEYIQAQSVSWDSVSGFTWGTRTDVAGPASLLDADIVSDSTGNATAVYEIKVGSASSEAQILAKRRVGGTWGTAAEIHPGAKLSDGDIGRSVAIDATGNVFVTYDIYEGIVNHDIGLRRFDVATSTWQPQRIVSKALPNGYRPVVAASALGGLVVFERRIGSTAQMDICASLCFP